MGQIEMKPERRILLGRIIGAFGVRGEVKVQSFTDPAGQLLRYQPWLLKHQGVERELSGVRARETAKGVTASFPDVQDRDAAEALTGAEIWVPRDRLPPPAPGEFYWVDLEGMDVVTVEGVALGKVSHLFATGANDVMVVVGERERLLPFVMGQYIRAVSLDEGRITVDWDPDF